MFAWWGLVTIQKNKFIFVNYWGEVWTKWMNFYIARVPYLFSRFLITIEWIWKSHLVSFIYLMLWHFLTCVLNVLVVALAGVRYLYVFKVNKKHMQHGLLCILLSLPWPWILEINNQSATWRISNYNHLQHRHLCHCFLSISRHGKYSLQ